MGALIPLPKIIFFLALLFLPSGTTKFSATIDSSKITWTRTADGWHAVSEGRDAGVWSVKGSKVNASGEETDVSSFVSVEGEEGARHASVKGKPVEVASTGSTLTLAQADGGALSEPVVITYSKGSAAIEGQESAATQEESAPNENAPVDLSTPTKAVKALQRAWNAKDRAGLGRIFTGDLQKEFRSASEEEIAHNFAHPMSGQIGEVGEMTTKDGKESCQVQFTTPGLPGTPIQLVKEGDEWHVVSMR